MQLQQVSADIPLIAAVCIDVVPDLAVFGGHGIQHRHKFALVQEEDAHAVRRGLGAQVHVRLEDEGRVAVTFLFAIVV